MAPEAGIYLRRNQAWVQLGRGVTQVPDPDPQPDPDPDPQPDPGPVTDYGATANLPKPGPTNTGPRKPLVDITPAAALATLRSTGYLSGVRITGEIRLGGTNGSSIVGPTAAEAWLLEDFEIIGNNYGFMSQYWSATSLATRPRLRYGRIISPGAISNTGSSSTVNAAWAVIDHCELTGSADGAKLWNNAELNACWVHDLWHNGLPAPDNSHADSVQVQAGQNIKIRWNNLDCYVGYSPVPSRVGEAANSCLQVGGVLGTLSYDFSDNWVRGGNYTVRGGGTSPAHPTTGLYRRNKFERNAWRFGAIAGMASGGGMDFDASNIYTDDGSPVSG